MINNVTLMGRLVASPEFKTTQTGVSVCRFRLAVDRDYKDKDGEKKADFISCTAWRETAEFINKYFSKGSLIALTGAIQTESYKDKDGNNRTSTEVVATRVSFCGEKKAETVAPATVTEEIAEDEDLPF